MEKVKQAVGSVLPNSRHNEAAWLDGKDARLRVDKSEMPIPAADEVVVKNHAVAVNPVDWKIQDRGLFIKNWPCVLGCDIAGEVVEVGSDVTKFKKGDRVMAHVYSLITAKPENGGFQLFTAAPAVTTGIVPSSISLTDASVLPLAINTAAHGLYAKKEDGFLGLPYPSLNPKPSGKTLVVWGGSSSVGTAAVQLAVASGAKVISTASNRNHALIKSLGASEVLEYNVPSIVEDVVKAVQTAGGEYIGTYDAISTEDSYKYTLPITEKLGGGVLACTVGVPKEVPDSISASHVFAVNPTVCGPVWEHYITPALEQGKLKPVPEPLIVGKGLQSVQKGLDTNKAGVSAKKVVIEL